VSPCRAHRGRLAGWLLFVLLVPWPAVAAAPARTPAPAAAPAPAAEPFDAAASQAHFTVILRVTGPAHGQFAKVDGALQPVAGGLWRVSVQIETADLRLDGPAWMLRSTRSAKFLDVANHPRIEFVSTGFRRELLQRGGELAGELTLRGQTRRVSFRLEPAGCATPGRGCPIRVTGSVDRRLFGMTAQRLWLRDTVGFDFRVLLRAAPAR
jgi:polyisoprenoid-binding protein YceI